MHSLIFNVERRSISRNLGPYRIAHYLRTMRWDVEVIDYAPHWTFEELKQLAETRITSKTKFIGFSFLFTGWPDLMETFSHWLRLKYPHVALISGSNDLPNKQINVDYHVWGFGEVALKELLKYLFSNGTEPKHSVIDGVKVINGSDYPAYPMRNYTTLYQERDFIEPWEFLSIETGRGCKFKCSFCNFSILGVKEDHSTSAESFEIQLKDNYERWGVKNYIITEETFNDRPEKIDKFANVVKGLDFDPWFIAYIRFDLMMARPDEMKRLEEMRVLGHYYGIESLHHPTAKAVRKGAAPSRVKEGLLKVNEYFSKRDDFRATVSMIVGAPLEPVESMEDSLNWLINNWGNQAVSYHPLFIPTTGRVSELSTTYSKYGYKEITMKQLAEKHPAEIDLLRDVESRSTTSLVWDSPHLDVLEAIKLNNQFRRKLMDNGFKKNVHGLAVFSGEGSTLEEKLEQKLEETHTMKHTEFEWYCKYKNKKLDWS